MVEGFRDITRWQLLLAVVLFVGTAGGVFGIYNWVSGTGSQALAADYQAVAVQRGDLSITVSASGTLAFPETEQLTFGGSGTVEAVYVQEDEVVQAGTIMATLDTASVLALEEAVTQARVDLEETRDDLEEAELACTKRAAVAQARIDLEEAQEALDDALEPYDESDLADALEAVARAREALERAQADAPIDIANAEYAVQQAFEDYSDAISQFMSGIIDVEDLKDEERDWEDAKLALESVKRSAENAIYDAESALEEAEEELEEVLEGADPLVVALREIELESAQLALAQAEKALLDDSNVALCRLNVSEAEELLENAIEKLDKATLTAPFDGVVSSASVEAGDSVTTSTAAIEIVSTLVVEVDATVDEIDIALLMKGQPVTVSLDAMPDLELEGEVKSISSFGQSVSGIMTYGVTVTITPPDDVQLREGMTAICDIVVESASDVLLVPNGAITGTSNNPTVTVLVDGQPQLRQIEVGMTDNSYTEVVSGLEEGDLVTVETTQSQYSSSSSSSSFPSGGFPMGGPSGGGGMVIIR